jgi:hypothetical protein
MSNVGEETFVRWAFLSRYAQVVMLGERVAYSWKCGIENHDHVIECLWVWHDCTMELDPVRASRAKHSDDAIGWGPTGVAAHDLISISPLHIEASVYWPACCGLHGWIRDGQWVDA